MITRLDIFFTLLLAGGYVYVTVYSTIILARIDRRIPLHRLPSGEIRYKEILGLAQTHPFDDEIEKARRLLLSSRILIVVFFVFFLTRLVYV